MAHDPDIEMAEEAVIFTPSVLSNWKNLVRKFLEEYKTLYHQHEKVSAAVKRLRAHAASETLPNELRIRTPKVSLTFKTPKFASFQTKFEELAKNSGMEFAKTLLGNRISVEVKVLTTLASSLDKHVDSTNKKILAFLHTQDSKQVIGLSPEMIGRFTRQGSAYILKEYQRVVENWLLEHRQEVLQKKASETACLAAKEKAAAKAQAVPLFVLRKYRSILSKLEC